MRTYGRTQDAVTGVKTWVVVETDSNGFNDEVYLTALAQVCKLNLGESPFWASWGIPARRSVITQVPPDYYMAVTQQRFAPFFVAITLQKVDGVFDDSGRPSPYYAINAITHSGAFLPRQVPI